MLKDKCNLISVIIPVYKVEKYLDKCIQSVINQTYSNLEIILVDDGSPDNCPQLCDDWANKGKRQTMRQSLKSTPPIIGDVASCIRPEDYLTMA